MFECTVETDSALTARVTPPRAAGSCSLAVLAEVCRSPSAGALAAPVGADATLPLMLSSHDDV